MIMSGTKTGILLYDGKMEFTTKEKIKVGNFRNGKGDFLSVKILNLRRDYLRTDCKSARTGLSEREF